ncbi:FtsX-like permease family protein [Candidatus Berkiella cookevillensis]|uniref:FtsX-like permease family protein n=1 Tax=Candidatus Berkiella cookevillensis TaxID=437022 RepID=A0A0Q9YP83_9GAMM|nr:FtsX-like permease family protein [Candidatus Berkiella cookevillensis]MCS5707439.1 FtsX-like permease family protein [Candidatus Berkiella cookevillensis]
MILNFIKRECYQFELKILSVAAMIGLMIVFLIANLLQGLSSDLHDRAENLMGGSVILESPMPIQPAVIENAKAQQLDWSQNTEFFTMMNVQDKFLLTQISAFDRPFPLIGEIILTTQDNKKRSVRAPPAVGEIWVTDRILSEFNLKMGDKVSVGNSELMVTGILQSYPLLLSRGTFLSPLAYANQVDIAKMGVVRDGSQINYRMIIKGAAPQIEAFLNSQLISESAFKLVTVDKGRDTLERPFVIANKYLSVVLIIQLLLSSIAIAICAHVYAKKQFKAVAIMRTLGASFNKVLCLYLSVLFVIVLAVVGLTALIGTGILSIIPYFSPLPISLMAGWGSVFGLTLCLGVLLVVGFSLPSLLALKQVSAIQIKQQAYIPIKKSIFLYYSVIVFIMIAVILSLFDEYEVPLRILSQLFIITAISFSIAWAMWRALAWVKPFCSYTLKMAVQGLLRLQWLGHTQWIIYSLIFTFLLFIEIVQHDILAKWQQQLPENTPNYFLINIQEDDVTQLENWFLQNNLEAIHLYPVIRATFTHINGNAVNTWGEGRSDEAAPVGLNRAINLTWMTKLPSDNQVIAGVEWESVAPNSPVISIEENFASRRNIKLGDELSFLIDSKSVSAKVTQLRTLHWQSFNPNFFVVFPPGILEDFPHSYIGSFHLPKEKRSLLNTLTAEFVEASLIDLDAMVDMMRSLVRQFSYALDIVLMLMLFTGLLLMQIIIRSLLKARMHESALLKILGVPKGLIQKTVLIEYGLLGGLCGLSAGLFAQLIAHDIAYDYFNIYYSFSAKWFVFGALFGFLLLTTMGWLGFRKVFKVSPLFILRQTG